MPPSAFHLSPAFSTYSGHIQAFQMTTSVFSRRTVVNVAGVASENENRKSLTHFGQYLIDLPKG